MGEKTVLGEVFELWRRLIDAPGVSVDRRGGYGPARVTVPTDEEIGWLVLANGGDGGPVEPIDLVLAEYSDYHGSSLDHANVRVLRDGFGVAVQDGPAFHGHSRAVVVLGELPAADDLEESVEQLRVLVQAMEHLADYPLLSDEAHSELETELADEAWSAYLWADIRGEITDHIAATHPSCEPIGGTDDEFDVSDHEDVIRELYYGYEHNEWMCESATSVTNLRHDDTMRHVIAALGQRNYTV